MEDKQCDGQSCTWTRVHDTTGQCHYETSCGKQVFASRLLGAGDPEYCYGCGRRVDISDGIYRKGGE